MATKKDLVEAYSFSRRRLVTAFVSGAPGGREVEPARPGRAVFGGIALAVLLIAGGAVLGVLKSPNFYNLDEEGLVSEKESGADYAVLGVAGGEEGETELRPLANITSAMLLFGAGIDSREVSREEIEDKELGDPIGILDAPETPPQVSDLVPTGWTACTGVLGAPPVGIKVDISEQPEATPTPDLSFVVRTVSGQLYLVAQSFVGAERGVERAYAYPVPTGGSPDRVLRAVAGAEDSDAVTVPDAWITLFPAGRALSLETFELDKAALRAPWAFRDQVPGAGRAEVGDLLRVGSTPYLMTARGTRELDEFSGALYQALQFPAQDPFEVFEADQVPATDIPDASRLDNAFWPTVVRGERRPAGQLCAQLDTPGGQPGVVLATTEADTTASAVEVGVDDVDVAVDSGAGAFVQSGGWSGGEGRAPMLVDARGYAYPVGPGEETASLGYADVDAVVVPQDWLDLFEPGVPLTVDAARCPPTSKPDGSCS